MFSPMDLGILCGVAFLTFGPPRGGPGPGVISRSQLLDLRPFKTTGLPWRFWDIEQK